MLDEKDGRPAHSFFLAILFLRQVDLGLMDAKTISSLPEYFYLVYLTVFLIAKNGF